MLPTVVCLPLYRHCCDIKNIYQLESFLPLQGYDQGPPRAMFEGNWIDVDDQMATDRGIYGVPEEPKDDFVDEMDTLKTFPDFLPCPHKDDGAGNKFVTIVDVSGIHYLPVIPCDCQGAPDKYDQFLNCNLFPASFIQVRTVFTAEVLKDFRISNLECKTSAYQYYSKLRRITCPAFPKLVINRYQELKRLSRQFRNLKLWKVHGRGHTAEAYEMYRHPSEPDQAPLNPAVTVTEVISESVWPPVAQTEPEGPPEYMDHSSSADSITESDSNFADNPLALFCPSCPQPGVNLPPDWEQDPNKWLYTRTFCADGNFKADHMNQRNEYDDVPLFYGEAFMTAPEAYKAHLKDAAKFSKKYTEVE